ncbi:MAG: four helix bundle protein [Chloroflexia bacterium]|nr:four helix bundle protein [Chloroflexia bacterium]
MEERLASGHGMARGRSYQDLVAWQRGMDLAEAVYTVTKSWPREERYSLTDQLRRAVVAVPSNIAEGHGRTGPREFLHHCSIACGSLSEAETQLLLAHHLGYVDQPTQDQLMHQTSETARLLHGLMKRLRSSIS